MISARKRSRYAAASARSVAHDVGDEHEDRDAACRIPNHFESSPIVPRNSAAKRSPPKGSAEARSRV